MNAALQASLQRGALLGLCGEFYGAFLHSAYWTNLYRELKPTTQYDSVEHQTSEPNAAWTFRVTHYIRDDHTFIHLWWTIDFKNPLLGKLTMMGRVGLHDSGIMHLDWERGTRGTSKHLQLRTTCTAPPLPGSFFLQLWTALQATCRTYSRQHKVPLDDKGAFPN